LPRFAFVIEGPPVSVNAKDRQSKKYQNWIKAVREAARRAWPPQQQLIPNESDVIVEIVNYFTLPPLDVDNVIKPVLDGLSGVVYEDDRQVVRVTSERSPASDLNLQEPEIVAKAVEYLEFLYIAVSWQTGEML
jgi:Holliday junction resolvase RusA-like endonuclease